MAGTITHEWNGTILTVTSDSGTSSCDLKGAQGDMGVRGPQGIPGTGIVDFNVIRGDIDTAVNIAHTGVGAIDKYALAQGMHTIANGYASLAQGYGCIAGDNEKEPQAAPSNLDSSNQYEGYWAHAEGNGTWAKGVGSHAEGYKTRAFSKYCHAEGYESTTNAQYSHVQGYQCKITGTGKGGHAEGFSTGVSGEAGHAQGIETKAIGRASHAGGIGTAARGDSQTVVGRYNKDNNSALFIVGDGTSGVARSNAFEVITNGIKIGDTTLTEAQLKSLLALL